MANGIINVPLPEVIKKIADIQEDLKRINIVLESINKKEEGQEGEISTDHACSTVRPWKDPD